MRKLQKAGRARHTYKLGEGDIKDTFATLEIADENVKAATGECTEFTGNASLRQLLCLLPSEGGDQAKDENQDESSDESVDEGASKSLRKGNLEPQKGI